MFKIFVFIILAIVEKTSLISLEPEREAGV